MVLAKEIGRALEGTYVNNIYSIGESQLVRFRRPGGEDVWLVVDPKRGVWVSGEVAERAETRDFTTRLRSELERARFRWASQVDLDRVFVLEFEKDGGRRLVVELMPPGNVIITDPEGRVLLAQTEVRAVSRRVVRGESYHPPRQSRLSPDAMDPDGVRRILEEEKTAGKAIGRHVALPRKYVVEALARLGVGEAAPSSALVGREEEVVRTLVAMVSEARDSPSPCLCEVPDGVEIYVIPPASAEPKEFTPTVSELCDRLFLEETMTDQGGAPPEEGKKRELEVTISRLTSDSEAYRADAEKIRGVAKAARAGPLEESLRLLMESGVRPSREPASAEAVASVLFDHAKGLEAKSAEAMEAAKRLEKRMPKAGPPGGPKMRPIARRRQEWFQKFRWFYTGAGRLAVGGRDAQSNTLLLTRHLEGGDVVYHADLFGSPFFILKGGRGQSESEVLELAQATVGFSSGWKTGLGAADAYWVLPDQVSKTAESGEYLAKGSFVIRGKKTFVRHVILQLALGVDAQGRVVAGPESAIARGTSRYVVIVPHREKPSDTAKKVVKELFQGEEGPLAPGLDDVIRALPSGGGKIVRKKGAFRDKP